MAIYKDENGEDVEALTPAEVDAKLAAEKATLEEGHTTKLTEKDGEITKLASEKAALEKKIKDAELAGIKEDHPNFKILKDALTKKDEEMGVLKTELETDRATRKKESTEASIKIAARGNAELEKKVAFHLEKTLGAMPDATPEEKQAKMQAALTLSGDQGEMGVFDGGISGGGRGFTDDKSVSGGPEFTGREKSLGAKMGISAEDYKKYGPRLNKK